MFQAMWIIQNPLNPSLPPRPQDNPNCVPVSSVRCPNSLANDYGFWCVLPLTKPHCNSPQHLPGVGDRGRLQTPSCAILSLRKPSEAHLSCRFLSRIDHYYYEYLKNGIFHMEGINQRGWLMKELRFAKHCK